MNSRARKGFLKADIDTHLRYSIYLYIVLLITEGALRKWILPGFSDILLLARDVLVIVTYAWALIHQRFPINFFVVTGALLVGITTVLAFVFSHQSVIVTIAGIRANFLHIPYAFLIGSVLYRKDVINIGKWWLIGSFGMTVIICLQFYSPQSAWINQSVGGGEGAGFVGAMGRYRPPGTFSFIIGIVQFYTLTAAFLICALTQHKRYSKTLIALAGIALIVAIPVTISRSLVIACFITFATAFLIICVQKKGLIRGLQILFFGILGLLIASQIPIFQESIQAFSKRWEHAQRVEGGSVTNVISNRIIDNMLAPYTSDNNIPFFGYGIGAGTPMGTRALHGERSFALGESDWERVVGEYGLLFGTLFLVWRITLSLKLLKHSLNSLFHGNGIPLILLSTAAYNIITGQMGQTTVNGFIALGIGLTIASMHISPDPITTSHKQANSSPSTEQS